MFQFTSREFSHQMISVYPTIKRQRRVLRLWLRCWFMLSFPRSSVCKPLLWMMETPLKEESTQKVKFSHCPLQSVSQRSRGGFWPANSSLSCEAKTFILSVPPSEAVNLHRRLKGLFFAPMTPSWFLLCWSTAGAAGPRHYQINFFFYGDPKANGRCFSAFLRAIKEKRCTDVCFTTSRRCDEDGWAVAPRLLRDELTARLSSSPVFIYSPLFSLEVLKVNIFVQQASSWNLVLHRVSRQNVFIRCQWW